MLAPANVVVVLGDERLYSEIVRDVGATSGLTILKLAKSGGVVWRDGRLRRRMRNLKLREYFYGSREDLAPHQISVPFADVELYQIGQGAAEPAGAARSAC